MTNLLLFLILIVLALILFNLYQIRIIYSKQISEKIRLRRLRNSQYPIFSEQELIDKKLLKDRLFLQIKDLENQVNAFSKQAKEFKKQGQPFKLTGEIIAKIERLGQLIWQKNQANDQYDKMVKLNLAVASGKEDYDKAWVRTVEFAENQKNSQAEQQFLNDFISRKKRLLLK